MKRFLATLALITALPLAAHASSPVEQRAAIQTMETETLNRLYKANPDAQRDVNSAVGYAVFSSGSLAIVWVSGGYGHGIAHNNQTGSDTYMEMASGGVGLGLGAKDYRTVFVFHDAKAMNNFIISGLDMSGSADAAAKVGVKGGAYSGGADILPGVRVYQLTSTGLMAQAMLQGTKYWVDKSLTVDATVPNTMAPSSGTDSYEITPSTRTGYHTNP